VSEQLILRLSSAPQQPIHWLVWSNDTNKTMAHGTVAGAAGLDSLTEKAQSRKVICLLPSVDITLKTVAMSSAFSRNTLQALPYMLEDELASDVERLHFSVIAKKPTELHVAVCEKHKMTMWLAWLNDADITPFKFIPDVLALPVPEEDKWQALLVDDQWLIRENAHYGWSCERPMLPALLALQLDETPQKIICSQGEAPVACLGDWQVQPPKAAIQVLAEGAVSQQVNLLAGEFKRKNESHLQLAKWKAPAIALVVLFAVLIAKVVIETRAVEQQIHAVQQHTEHVYKTAFPTQRALKYSRIKKRIRGLLGQISNDSGTHFLSVLNTLLPVFEAVPSLQINNLKFNQAKQEILFSVSTNSFQAYEQLAQKMPSQYQLQQGALSSNKDRVSGELTVKVK